MKHKTPTFIAAVSLLLGSTSMAFAQDATDGDDQGVELVFITGTFIPKQSGKSSSPLAVVNTQDIRDTGAGTIADVIQNLTINTGSQNYTDAFTQNVSTGTTNVNLRGLGVSSTLILLNGNRQVVSGAPTDGGLLFVDTSSLIPMIAIGRIEIVKDGATSTYGSDAVAGVINFITRNDFSGVEISVGGRTVTEDSQRDLNVEGIFGFGNDTTHFMAAFGYLDRTSLTTAERRFPGSVNPITGDFSNAGQPGSFIVPYFPSGSDATTQALWSFLFDPSGGGGLIPGIADFVEPLLGAPIVPGALVPLLADPDCSAGENSVVPTPSQVGFCRLDFGDFFDLVAEEERMTGFASFTQELGSQITFNLEFSASRNRATRNNSPSFPIPSPQAILTTLPGTPDPSGNPINYNPFNPFGTSPFLDASLNTLPIFFVGRVLGEGSPAPSTHDSDTYRIYAGFEGTFGENGAWQVNFTHADNDFEVTVEDTLADRFSLALNGLGGAGCDPSTGTPGLGGCQFFNPFGSALLASSGTTVPHPFVPVATVPVANDPALIAWFTSLFTQNYYSTLTVIDAIATNSLSGVLPNPIQYAIGVQYRKTKYSLDYDDQANADNYLFVIGGPDFDSSQEVFAIFAEMDIPVHERVDIQLSVRYENYDQGVGDSIDPKVGFVVRAADTFTIRGTFGTAFRAPNGFQLFGTQTSVQQLTDTLPGQPTTPSFAAVRTTGTGMLVPETSTTFNFGFTWEATEYLTVDFNYWRFNFEDIVVQESAQAILNANPLDPRITRSPVTGSIVIINTNFVNASSLKTSGFDTLVEYRVPLNDAGDLRLGIASTYISQYDLDDPQAGLVSGAGSRNFNNFGTSTPQWRFTGSINWEMRQHAVNIYIRFIDSYLDDQNDAQISSHTTVDLQYNFTLGDRGDFRAWRLAVGVINVFNNFPPFVATNQGFDTKVHDPRGRMVYGSVTKGF